MLRNSQGTSMSSCGTPHNMLEISKKESSKFKGTYDLIETTGKI